MALRNCGWSAGRFVCCCGTSSSRSQVNHLASGHPCKEVRDNHTKKSYANGHPAIQWRVCVLSVCGRVCLCARCAYCVRACVRVARLRVARVRVFTRVCSFTVFEMWKAAIPHGPPPGQPAWPPQLDNLPGHLSRTPGHRIQTRTWSSR